MTVQRKELKKISKRLIQRLGEAAFKIFVSHESNGKLKKDAVQWNSIPTALIKSDGSFIFFLLQKSWNAMRIFSMAMQISKRAIASQKFSTLHRFLEYMLYVEVICTFGQLLAIEEISA